MFETFTLNGYPHLIIYRDYTKSDMSDGVLRHTQHGAVKILRINSDGKGVNQIWESTGWTAGYTNFTAFEINGHPYIFLYKRKNGNSKIVKISVDGNGVSSVWDDDWNSNWTHFVPLTIDDNPVIFRYKGLRSGTMGVAVGDGDVTVSQIQANGTQVRTTVHNTWYSSDIADQSQLLERDETWHRGWTALVPIEHNGKNYVLAYMKTKFTKKLVRKYEREKHEFRFGNSFSNWAKFSVDVPLLGEIDIPSSAHSNGLCGGMVFAVRDYFEAGYYLSDSTQRPDASSALGRYIVARLIDSWDPEGLMAYLPAGAWDSLTKPISDLLGFKQTIDEINLFRTAIANFFYLMSDNTPIYMRRDITREQTRLAVDDIIDNHPSPLGLILSTVSDPFNTSALGNSNHYVLAYGFDERGEETDLIVYDPNRPYDENDPQPPCKITISNENRQWIDSYTTIQAFFCAKYSPKTPPRHYNDTSADIARNGVISIEEPGSNAEPGGGMFGAGRKDSDSASEKEDTTAGGGIFGAGEG